MSNIIVALIVIVFISQTLFLLLDVAMLSGFTQITRACKMDLVGWKILEYVLFVSVIVLFLANFPTLALIYLAAHVYLMFKAKTIQGKRVYQDLKDQGKLDMINTDKPEL